MLGESVTVHGYTITLDADCEEIHTVTKTVEDDAEAAETGQGQA